jgi:Uma2 family endonuclease
MAGMVSLTGHAHYTLEEYLALEEYSNVKHEYLDGVIYAMAGGTPEHGAMCMRIGAALIAQLGGRRCSVFSSDVRVRVTPTGLDTYPDLSVVCGEAQRDTQDRNALVNPIAIVEVTSPSTEDYDRGEKLEHYRQISSLRHVVLVSHRREQIEVWTRDEAGAWAATIAESGQRAALPAIGCSLDVEQIYFDPLG